MERESYLVNCIPYADEDCLIIHDVLLGVRALCKIQKKTQS